MLEWGDHDPGNGAEFESVDFLVTYEGRVAAIEVDGNHHHGRWVADRSRDRLLQDAWFHYVDRIDAEEPLDDEAAAFVHGLLDRLTLRKDLRAPGRRAKA